MYELIPGSISGIVIYYAWNRLRCDQVELTILVHAMTFHHSGKSGLSQSDRRSPVKRGKTRSHADWLMFARMPAMSGWKPRKVFLWNELSVNLEI